MLKDIGYPYVKSHTLFTIGRITGLVTDSTSYSETHPDLAYRGCWFKLQNSVEVTILFEKSAPHPATENGIIHEVDSFLTRKISYMRIEIPCAD
jgi:hypothetical protein